MRAKTHISTPWLKEIEKVLHKLTSRNRESPSEASIIKPIVKERRGMRGAGSC